MPAYLACITDGLKLSFTSELQMANFTQDHHRPNFSRSFHNSLIIHQGKVSFQSIHNKLLTWWSNARESNKNNI